MTPAGTLETVETDELEGGFSRKALGWIIGVVAASLLATVLLMIHGKDLEQPKPGHHSFSTSALGHRALIEFLNELGINARPRQSVSGGGVGPLIPLVLAEPEGPGWNWDRLDALRREAKTRKAPLVIVLPKWAAGDVRKDRPDWLSRVRLLPEERVLELAGRGADPNLREGSLGRVRDAQQCFATWPGESRKAVQIEIETIQLLQPDEDLHPLVECAGGALVAQRYETNESPRIVLIADPDLLNNQGLDEGDNALVTYQVFKRGLGARGAVFDETIHGFTRTRGLLNEVLRFPLVLAVVQGLILLGVVLWAGIGRFGKPLPVSLGLAAGKEILIDNTAKLLANGGHAADGVVRYFRQETRAVAAHYFLPPDLPDGERVARLQKITNARGIKMHLGEIERTLHQLPQGRQGEEQAVRYAGRLHDWRVEMTNGH